jgi:hypothetical protein
MSDNWREDYRNNTDSELYRIIMGNREHHSSRLNKEFAEDILKERGFDFKKAEDNFYNMNGGSILSSIEYMESYKFKPPAWAIFLFMGPGAIIFFFAINGFDTSVLYFSPIIIVFAILFAILSKIAIWIWTTRLKNLHKKFDKIVNASRL